MTAIRQKTLKNELCSGYTDPVAFRNGIFRIIKNDNKAYLKLRFLFCPSKKVTFMLKLFTRTRKYAKIPSRTFGYLQMSVCRIFTAVEKMRLDKFLSQTKTLSRSEASKAAKAGLITVNGVTVRDCSTHIAPETDVIGYQGAVIKYRKFIWIMMNKPSGVLSASDDKKAKTVIDLLPPPLCSMGLFPCGRLDKDTVGLLLITNDGELSHKLLTPKNHAKKTYRYVLSVPYDTSKRIEDGVPMDGKITKPAVIVSDSPVSGTITLTEGKYHQIKRMFEYAGSKVTFLQRTDFAGLHLDNTLKDGEWRYLTEEETEILKKAVNS